ncbi:2-hydroxyacid dehydrogenase [Sediminispirochaeta smaragdinae]|uniref:D-isomer specific 2-hydroxyacid dehydrogenase NAD-binding protein n=1 Tax=Sediminispirochaeta smaragdinae (strain DSM 11293 / JCM 15392 / SEBR 4228) TaxID=573413 RepID=E1R9D6_SEDSS|nr:2-hydroxyacid dehydrogenase [Sediminispirochaeta smaragdinae]ADK83105.1 D-isomer specific 2-hydroxyacid dehydrogenase NAD-binding protein [Sediminispirochaeta smaragdinae DSM 11293]
MKKKLRVAFFDTKPYDRHFFDLANTGETSYEITYIPERLSRRTAHLVEGFDAVCAFVNDDLSKPVLDHLVEAKVPVVALRSAGYNNVDLQAAWERIHILRVPAYSPYAVAEHAVAMMLSLNRKLHRAYYRTRDNNFSINGFLGFDMNGKTAGVIGTGKIGRTLLSILKGFGMRIIAYDAFPNEKAAEEIGFSYHTLEELYAESDIISLHCPLTPDTHHLINHEAISRMKPSVMIINTSRGQLVDTDALLDGLREKRIGSAGLDVYEEEGEYFFEDLSNEALDDDRLARLLTLPNVLVTSHQAFFTEEALRKIASTTLSNLDAWFAGEALENEICYRCNEPECRKEKAGRCF